MWTIILVTVAAICFYYYFIKPYKYWKERGVGQGNPWWIFGDTWSTILRFQTPPEMLQSIYNQHPGTRYTGMYQMTVPTLMIKDLELIKKIAVKDFDHFTDHPDFVSADSDPLWALSLLNLKGQKWRDMRTTLSPTFTSSKMRTIFALMKECAENFAQHFLKKNEEVITVEMKDVLSRFANDIIATTAFGLKVDSLTEKNNTFYLMGREATDFSKLSTTIKFFGYLLFPKIYRILKIRLLSKEVTSFFEGTINDTIKIREEKSIIRPDMIHLLLEARKNIQKHEEGGITDTEFAMAQESNSGEGQKSLTNEDIASQAFVFFFAGFDTISSTMCFTSYELAVHQEIQKTLRKEILNTFEECKGELTYEALSEMKYMDMVISETMRKWPNFIAADRICTKPYTIPAVNPGEKPVHLEEGAIVWIPTYAIQHDPEHYPDPERFDPERFNDENKQNIKPYSYIPFGVGQRNCIGSRFALMEMKVLFFYILLNYEIVPVEKTKIPIQISKKSFFMTADGGFWLGLKRIRN